VRHGAGSPPRTSRHDPAALFLANHQVALESILFIVAASALCDMPIKVIAKAEHWQTWMGRLTELTHSHEGFHGPDPTLLRAERSERASETAPRFSRRYGAVAGIING
jgi:hypothetical protein